MNFIKMCGPKLDGSGEIVNRDVPETDIQVYARLGYKPGSVNDKPVPPAAPSAPDISSGSIELPEEEPRPTPRKKATKK
jgi:hypothetical protein